MTQDQFILFALFATVFVALIWGRWRYDLVAFGALMAAVLLGVVDPDRAFEGFGHPATLVVALVLVVSAGLVRSGAVYLITRTLVNSARGLGAHIAIMGGIGGLLSAFMNNVAALALLMPVDIQTARKAGRAPGLSLMPLSFATILGGMVTLIGTPPNIIIAAFRQDATGQSFRMFDFAPVGGVAALAGIVFVALVGWRLIPKSAGLDASADPMSDYSSYIAELTVPEGSKLIGRRLADLDPEAEANDVALLGLVRGGKRLYGLQRGTALAAGDSLVIEASPEALDEFRAALSLDFAEGANQERLKAEGAGLTVIEVVVPEQARIAGRSAQLVGLAWRRRTVLLGISRQGRPVRQQIRKTKVRPGDILLLLTPQDVAQDVVDWLGCLTLADRGLAVTDTRKTWIAIGLFAAAVAAASVGLVDLTIAIGLVVVGYVAARIIPINEVYSHVEWPVVVLLGSMIPLGVALEESGGTRLIAETLLGLTGDMPPWVILTALMVATMCLSDVLNNTATTVVAAPVGIQMAQALGVSPDPFLMAVAVAASCAFLTPIGHKNNTLILGPGGYRFGDYWRMGLPLEIIVIAVSVPMILLVWPFQAGAA
ncbi:SLC13 family permease [Rhodovulum sulfidophilum]|uniref:SLC13 family permease n=1 Tax=Rhodovulum sulfidophilum TaxID=35806 RepID=UPI0013893BC3|nr:SLC13 family permease [Rhodovulum sulfidophilum]MBL3595098.1 SLC13 family permease [Rhodovulum sulfidophilum]NDK33577.1 SLC13 family permease [Rhodovulum sulfidophilum]